jgi:hypothetical protein
MHAGSASTPISVSLDNSMGRDERHIHYYGSGLNCPSQQVEPRHANRISRISEAMAMTRPAISWGESGSRNTVTPMHVSIRIIDTE